MQAQYQEDFNPGLIVEVTNLCDKKCPGCYAPNVYLPAGNFSTAVAGYLKPEQLKTTLSRLKKEFPKIFDDLTTISFRGGEPTLSPWLGQLTQIARQFQCKPIIETHGLWLLDNHDGVTTQLLSQFKFSQSIIKLSFDRMHGSTVTNLQQMIAALKKWKLDFYVAVTCLNKTQFEDWIQPINFVPHEKFIFQRFAQSSHELIQPKYGVLSWRGLLQKIPTHKFKGHIIALLLLLFTGKELFANITTVVPIGIAANFSQMTDSTANPYSNHFKYAIDLALEEYKPRLKKKNIQVQFREFDYGVKNEQILSTAKEAIQSNVLAVLGYIYSSHVLLAGPIFQNGKLLLVTPTATADSVENIGRYVRRTCINDSTQGRILATQALNQGIKNVAIISAMDCAYCQSLRRAFHKNFQQIGGRVASDIRVLSKNSDWQDQFKVLSEKKLDAIFLPNYEKVSGLMVQQIKSLGIHPKYWLGGDGWGNVSELFFKISGTNDVVAFTTSHWHEDIKTALSEDFRLRFKARFKTEPLDTSALTYDAARLLFDALLASKQLTRQGLLEAIESITEFQMLTGKAVYRNKRRTPEKPAVILKISKGKVNLVRLVK